MTQSIPLADIQAGDTLVPDASVVRLPAGVPRPVHRYGWLRRNLPLQVLTWLGLPVIGNAPGADLYVESADGHLTLDRLLNSEGTHLVGFTKVETPNEKEADDSELSNEEIVSYEAELTEDVDSFKAGHRFTIMGLESGKLRLLDDDGNALLTERAKIRVIEW